MKTKANALVLILAVSMLFSSPASAELVDLSDATSGPLITGVFASFTQTFEGQTVEGNGISGTPTSPLTLLPSGEILVDYFNDENTLLPQPDNAAPLSCLLILNASGVISWAMGSASPPSSVDIDFFDEFGTLVYSVHQELLPSYETYTFDVPEVFRGFTIYNNNDASGLRYYHFEFTPAGSVATEQLNLGGVKALYLN